MDNTKLKVSLRIILSIAILGLTQWSHAGLGKNACVVNEKKSILYDRLLAHNNQIIYGDGHDALAQQGFLSELEAVKAASDRFNPISIAEDTEFIGAILKRNGQYFYSAQRGAPGRDQVSLHFRYPKTYDLVAFWHTHGAEAKERNYFSDFDTRVVEQTGKPFYLSDFSGELKVFKVGNKILNAWQALRKGLPRQSGFAEGEKVRDRFGKLVMICTSLGQG